MNGRGTFLVPGLADMHAHDIEPPDLELYAAAGVTQLRVLAAGRNAVVRKYDLELLVGSERVPGSLVLDTDNHLVEQQLGSQRTIRIE